MPDALSRSTELAYGAGAVRGVAMRAGGGVAQSGVPHGETQVFPFALLPDAIAVGRTWWRRTTRMVRS